MQANLVEIFSSVQGEGPHVGASTLFVRFGGCDLRCAWCDSPHTWRPAERCRLEITRGSGHFREVPSPLALPEAVAAIEALDPSAHRFVSFTGGEPLLQASALVEVARALRGGTALYLETHGLAVPEMQRVAERVDVVAMDWKLASDVRVAATSTRSAHDFGPLHARFLSAARSAPEVFVKIVVTPRSQDEEIRAAAQTIASQDPQIPLVLQPVTPVKGTPERPEARWLLELAASLEGILAQVLVIPQTHPVYGAP